MFLRTKKNKSGVVSVQIIDKSSGNYKMIKTIGSSSDSNQIEYLENKGKLWIKNKIGQKELDFTNERDLTESILDNIEQITVVGTSILLGAYSRTKGLSKYVQFLIWVPQCRKQAKK